VTEGEYCCYLLFEEGSELNRRWSKESIDIQYMDMIVDDIRYMNMIVYDIRVKDVNMYGT